MDVPILYEDDDIVVINKPAGILVHADDAAREQETIASWHALRVPSSRGIGEPMRLRDGSLADRPGVVHRLDRETSGALVLAKNAPAFLSLKQQFHDRLVEKEYRAFVHGVLKEKRGIIDRPIGKSARDFRLRSAQRGARGALRPAITEWELIRAGSHNSYLMLRPKTGRTHQLRVHLKAINYPIVCDSLYAPNQGCALGFSRLALHAHRLGLILKNGVRATFEAPLPDDFRRGEELL